MSTLLIALLSGIVVGLLIGGLGGGGAILSIPVLVYGASFSAHEATVASLIIVGIGALAGLAPHLRRGNVRWREGAIFGGLGIIGSFIGSRLAVGIDGRLLLTLFAILLLIVAGLMIRKSLRGSSPRRADRAVQSDPADQSTANADRTGGNEPTGGVLSDVSKPRLVATASGVGLLTGFFGVGGGFAIVPALSLVLGFSMNAAIGTSLLVMLINSLVTLGLRAGELAQLDWTIVTPFAGATVLGTVAGARLMSQVPRHVLQRGFAGFLVLVALYMLAQNVLHLS